MKKILKILLIVDACVAVIFLFGGMIMEILRAIPFSKNSTFDLIWYIFCGGAYITGAPFLIIFIVCFIKFSIQKFKKNNKKDYNIFYQGSHH